MNFLTILTPTYNRASNLPQLYESLKRQGIQRFKWLLIDDGSDDETENLVRQWQKENYIEIGYQKKSNGGKHTALNTGIKMIDTELTFIVDSDDWLPKDAIEKILACHERFGNRKDICGYSFLRFYPDGKVNEAFFPSDEMIDTYVNTRINGNIAGDKAEVFFTEILKQYPFPIYGEEKFLPEDLIWVKMSGPWKMVHVNECIYISEYLEGGLTKSGRGMKLNSPRGMMARSYVYLTDTSVNMKTKLKMAVLYNVYMRASDRNSLTKEERERQHWLITLCKVPGRLLYCRWKKKYQKQ